MSGMPVSDAPQGWAGGPLPDHLVEADAEPSGDGAAGLPSTEPRSTKSGRKWWIVGIAAAAVVALIAGVAIGRVGETSQKKLDRAETQLVTTKQSLQAMKQARDQVQHDVVIANHRADDAEANAKKDADAAYASRRSQLESAYQTRKKQLDDRQAALDKQAADLKAQQDQLNAQVAAANAAQFGDGIFEVGRDIQPGTYHTDGGGDCYYALLSSGDGSFGSIISNNNTSGPATVTISSAYFESNGCGTWQKVA